jgi:cyanate permease
MFQETNGKIAELAKSAPGIAMMMSIPGAVIGTLITQRSGLRCPVMRFAGLILIPAAFGMFLLKDPIMIVICAAFTGTGLQLGCPAFYCIPQELPGTNHKKASYMMAIFFALIYLAATVNVWVAGKIIEASGNNYILGFLFICIVGAISLIGLFLLPETGPGKNKGC